VFLVASKFKRDKKIIVCEYEKRKEEVKQLKAMPE